MGNRKRFQELQEVLGEPEKFQGIVPADGYEFSLCR